MSAASAARAWLFLVTLTLSRQLRSRKNWIPLVFLGLLAAILYVIGRREPISVDFVVERILPGPFGSFIFPMLLLGYGASAFGEEREEKTLVYLRTRPLWRWASFVAKYLGVAPLAVVFGVGGLWILCRVAALGGDPEPIDELLRGIAGAYALAALAYLAVFHLFAAVFRHATLISVVYVFFIEVFVGRVPGVIKCLSVNYYTTAVVRNRGETLGVEPPDPLLRLPIESGTALTVLLASAACFLALGALVASAREYRDAV